ncbi:MAG: 4'-phosphopantetheinyl transferase superfamily protein [Burkholderiales bacterium]
MEPLPNVPDLPRPRVAGDVWRTSSGRVELRGGEVHVWRIDLAGLRGAAALATLSDAERARAGRFRFPGDRDRFVASHAALRAILASCVDAAPAALSFGESVHGKPFVAAPAAGRALRFSLSHSGDVALVAVSRGLEVGVDVERVRALDDLEGFAARYFSPRECAALAQIAASDRLRAFFETWTLKEAYLKACGDGLARALDAFDVTVGAAQPRLLAVRDRPGDEARWKFERIDSGPGHAAAIAAPRDWERTRYWRGGE